MTIFRLANNFQIRSGESAMQTFLSWLNVFLIRRNSASSTYHYHSVTLNSITNIFCIYGLKVKYA